jgi:uncharacterized protein (TIGR00106 family)
MLFSISMFPIGEGESLVEPVAEVVDEIDAAGLSYQVTSMDTQVEGEWDEVVPVIRRAFETMLEAHPRVFLLLSVDEHRGAARNRLTASVDEVGAELGRTISR